MMFSDMQDGEVYQIGRFMKEKAVGIDLQENAKLMVFIILYKYTP